MSMGARSTVLQASALGNSLDCMTHAALSVTHVLVVVG